MHIVGYIQLLLQSFITCQAWQFLKSRNLFLSDVSVIEIVDAPSVGVCAIKCEKQYYLRLRQECNYFRYCMPCLTIYS